MKFLVPIAILLVIVGTGIYFSFYYPPVVLKRATEKQLEAFAQMVATKDRAKVGEALNQWLADDARITLTVSFFSLTQPDKGTKQDFDKQSFIAFIDNVLYPLSDFSYERPELENFVLANDRNSATLSWEALTWADGVSLYGGVGVNMRYSANPACNGQVVFENKQPRLKEAQCIVQIRPIPKPGEEQKLRDANALGDYIKR